MEKIKTHILIIGGGAAGLNSAFHLRNENVILIEKNGSNSILSPWNLMVKPEKQLEKEMLESGDYLNDPQLLESFLKNYREVIEDLKNIGVKLRKSNIGLIPDYNFPGLAVRKIFLKKLKKRRNLKFLKGRVENFLVSKDQKVRGVIAYLFESRKNVAIFFNYLILAAGGLGAFFKFTTGSKDCDGSILSLCYEVGLKMRDLEFFMFHPFLIVDKRLPNVLLSGEILTKMEFEDEKGEKFLSKKIALALKTNKHHSLFPQMTREFYLKSLKSKIFGRLKCSNEWFERFKKENEFGFIFKDFTKSEIKRIEIHPAFHYFIGGLAINKYGQTSQENVYAAGEITGGLHGSNRIGGLAILDALVFSKLASLDIIKKSKSKKKIPTIPRRVEKIGSLGLSQSLKEKIWRALGPIKMKKELEELESFLNNKKTLTSQEKLLKEIVRICLTRKKSIGTFTRDDLLLKKGYNQNNGKS